MIGRAHKSNNIYWIIDFRTWTCTQGCWDRECFGRGSEVPIPKNELHLIQTQFREWQEEEEFEKALLGLNLEDPKERNDLIAETHSNEATSTVGKADNGKYANTMRTAREDTSLLANDVNATTSSPADTASHNKSNDGTLATVDDVANTSSFLSDDALLDAIYNKPSFFP